MTRALGVWWDGAHVGDLMLDDNRDLAFAYDTEWREDPSRPAISVSMPKREQPYGRRVTRAFFSGLLPEERQREGVARALGVSKGNDFRLLEELGGDVAGALTLWRADETPPEPRGRAATTPLNEAQLIDILETLPRRPMLAGEGGMRVSLAGAQAKLPHQEDFCQALGIQSENKYAAEGGPIFRDCFELVRRACNPPAPAALQLLDAALFNLIVGNTDAHGKNYSLLYTPAGCRMAPLYDLMCTVAYPEAHAAMAMKMGRRSRLEEFRPDTLALFAQEIGMASAFVARRAQSLARAAQVAAGPTAAQIVAEGFAEGVLNPLAECVIARAARLEALMGAKG